MCLNGEWEAIGVSKNSVSENERLGRFISLVLRHKPETIGLKLDKNGWVNCGELINGINRTGKYYINSDILDEIVRTNSKKRYSFSEDGKRIRANQGHSVKVDVGLKECRPPEFLYHGTAEKSLEAIFREGLKPMGRLYVHLSPDIETAINVGKRHGKPVVLRIDAGEMYLSGDYKFFLSENGVWLAESVPPEYINLAGTDKRQ